MSNEENHHKKNKPQFKRYKYWRFVKIKYKESQLEEEINNYKIAIALQMGNNFYITNEKVIHSQKGHRVTIKEIYNTIPSQANGEIIKKYLDHRQKLYEKQLARRERRQKLNTEKQKFSS